MKTLKLILTALLLSTILSCSKENDDIPVQSSIPDINSAQEENSHIPKAAVKELHQLIENGAFDKEIEESKNPANKAIGDGKSRGTIGFDLVTREVTLKGLKTGELCPKTLVRGDREFGGGPLINNKISLYYSNPHLFGYVTFNAKETKGDKSEVKLAQWIFLRSDIRDIRAITTGTSDYVSYRGKNAGPEFFHCNDGTPERRGGRLGVVKKFDIIGDTGGSDISSDDNCHCDTKIRNIEFNTIRFSL